MEASIEVLHLYVEVVIAFVAFAAIVATLRQSFGGKLTSLQYILFRWFVEVGLLHVIVAFSIIVIHSTVQNTDEAWQYSCALIGVAIPLYLFSYLRRRAKLGLKMPPSSKFVTVGYAVLMLYLFSSLAGIVASASFQVVLIYLTWSLASLLIVFLQFLSLFIDIEQGSSDP